MSQQLQADYEADSDVISYYDDIVNSNDPCIGMDSQFDLISMGYDPLDEIIIDNIKVPGIKESKKYNEQDFELVTIPGKPKDAAKIREHFYNLSEYGDNITLGKAIEKGAKYVREYYNEKNLRRRLKC